MRLLHVGRDISLFLSAGGADEARSVVERRTGAAYEPRLAELAAGELRRPPRRAGRDADVGAGARDRAVSEDLDRGRAGRRRLHGHRRAHRPQVTVAARALDGRRRARRGGRLAHGPPGRVRHARATRRARARPRPHRRVECDLGEARAARVRRVGARAAPSALHGARLRPVAGARSDRDARRLAPRTARRLRLPPRHARAGARPAGPHPRRRRLLRGDARGAPVQAGARRVGSARRSCCRRSTRGGSTPRPSTRCSPPPATACGSDRASCPPG